MEKTPKSMRSQIVTSSEKQEISTQVITTNDIESKILNIRNLQVILDKDLAFFYEVKPIRLREQLKRNPNRFPSDFVFQLTKNEVDYLVSQNAIPSIQSLGGSLPYAFTEQGVAAVSAVLKSEKAAQVSINIIRTFVAMRKFLLTNAQVFQRLESLEIKQIGNDDKFERIFDALDNKEKSKTQGIFFDGQIYDAYSFVIDLIRKAEKEIVLIDGYVDNDVLDMLSKKQTNVSVILYTLPNANINKTDIKKFNAQYPTLKEYRTTKVHDRYLIIDNNELYTIGASLKDLGKKCFSFTKMEEKELIGELLNRLV
ncbi:MAG: ORF6N domain-containing protein [Bacteroidales bacterium]|nr:ORF6N domain-containing protein [Bacteroidales bacterium]MDD4529729.1 ORF6N domain-containing protein [Bacteroidales bacterium]MDY4790900.1 ORF6N domain-containing protein [Bacteroidales bacterium]